MPIKTKKENDFKRIPQLHKHIYKLGNRFRVEKSINGEHKVFKTFSNITDAIKYRDKLIANNWEDLPLTPEEVYEQNHKEYYMGLIRTYNGRRYQVNNCKGEYLATIPTIEEALFYRDQYYTYNKNDAPRPSTLDLTTNNWYINEGLEYPIPERLIPFKNTAYGEGSIQKNGKHSYKIIHGGKNNEYSRYVCSCRTYEQAYYVKQEMNKCNWDRKQLQKILDNYPIWYTKLMELYRYVNLDYEAKKRTGQIKYWITIPRAYLEEGKQLETITGYTHVEDALFERDFLVAHNWDYDLLVEAIDDTKNQYYDMTIPPYPQRKILNLKERDYHEKELTLVHELLNDDSELCQEDISEILGITEVTFRNWLSKFWNTNWSEFKRISLSGENPINVLEKVPHIYTPDLSRPKPSNYNGYVHVSKKDKRSPYKVIKDNIRYGSYYTEKQARKAVKLLKQCNWDKSKVSEIQEKVGWKPLPKRGNVYPVNKGKGWTIRRKNKERKMINYGYYEDKRIAELTRDFLKENDWSKEIYPGFRSLAEYIIRLIDDIIPYTMFNGNSNTVNEYNILDFELIDEDYYYQFEGKYHVSKLVDGEPKYYGEYDSEEEAKEIVEVLQLNNWDESVLTELKGVIFL